MKNSLKLALCATLTLACTSITAHASSITSIVTPDNGVVLIERAGDFQIATEESLVIAQDRILSSNGTSANVMLSANCSVSLTENQVMNVVSTTGQDCASMYTLEAITAGDLDAVGASNLQGGNLGILFLVGAVGIAGIIAATDGSSSNNIVTPPAPAPAPSSP